MALRVPGASTPEQFWKNISGGIESITRFEEQELLANGVPAAVFTPRRAVPPPDLFAGEGDPFRRASRSRRALRPCDRDPTPAHRAGDPRCPRGEGWSLRGRVADRRRPDRPAPAHAASARNRAQARPRGNRPRRRSARPRRGGDPGDQPAGPRRVDGAAGADRAGRDARGALGGPAPVRAPARPSRGDRRHARVRIHEGDL